MEPFANANAWAAVYYTHERIRNVRNEIIWDAEYVFINALETSLVDHLQVRASRMYLGPVVRWLEICGEDIYRLCDGTRQELRPNWSTDSGIVDYGGEWLWKHGHVFNMQRWRYWLARCSALSRLESFDEESRCLAKRALAVMESHGQPEKRLSVL